MCRGPWWWRGLWAAARREQAASPATAARAAGSCLALAEIAVEFADSARAGLNTCSRVVCPSGTAVGYEKHAGAFVRSHRALSKYRRLKISWGVLSCSSTSWLSLQGAFAPRVWVKMFICYQPLVPEVGREAKLPLRIDSEDLLGIVQLCFQNVLTYLHNKTNQNNINSSGELLDCSGCVWQWVFMSFSQYRQNLNTTEILNTTTPWYPWQTACCFSCLLGKGDGLAAVQLEQMLVKQQTKKKSTRVDLSFCHIE